MEAEKESLSELSRLVKITLDLEEEIEKLQDVIDEKQAHLKQLIETDIPSAMETLGNWESITTGDGWKIEIKHDYHASISEANYTNAMRWLVDNDFEDLIKHDLTLSFSRGEHGTAEEVRDRLSAEGYAVKDKENVHSQTLKAWVREQKEQGTEIPDELFGVYPVTKAKITKGK